MRDNKEGWIFPSLHKDSGTGHRARMDGPFRDAVKRAGLDSALVTPHVMRHTAITKLVQAGVDLPTVRRISGHKTLAMVMRYSHVHGQHIDRAIRAIGRTVKAPSANKTGDTVTPELHMHTHGKPRLAWRRKIQGAHDVAGGGRKRNRTAVRGFAVLCIATLPSGHSVAVGPPLYRLSLQRWLVRRRGRRRRAAPHIGRGSRQGQGGDEAGDFERLFSGRSPYINPVAPTP